MIGARGLRTVSPKRKTRVNLLAMSDIDAEFFARLLKPQAPDTAVIHVPTLADLESVSARDDLAMRLISFCSAMVIPARIIARLSGNCLNFHPGPPERPGYMPAPFALADGARDYGVTFHFMLPVVDTGRIIEVRRFPLEDGMDQEAIERKSYEALLTMVAERAPLLADIDHIFQPCGEKWSGKATTKADLQRLKDDPHSPVHP